MLIIRYSLTNSKKRLIFDFEACMWNAHGQIQIWRPCNADRKGNQGTDLQQSNFQSSVSRLLTSGWNIQHMLITRYVERYWRPTVFKGLQLIRNALDRRYGVNKVSLVNAALRWLTHHSYLSPDNGGNCCIISRIYFKYHCDVAQRCQFSVFVTYEGMCGMVLWEYSLLACYSHSQL